MSVSKCFISQTTRGWTKYEKIIIVLRYLVLWWRKYWEKNDSKTYMVCWLPWSQRKKRTHPVIWLSNVISVFEITTI